MWNIRAGRWCGLLQCRFVCDHHTVREYYYVNNLCPATQTYKYRILFCVERHVFRYGITNIQTHRQTTYIRILIYVWHKNSRTCTACRPFAPSLTDCARWLKEYILYTPKRYAAILCQPTSRVIQRAEYNLHKSWPRTVSPASHICACAKYAELEQPLLRGGLYILTTNNPPTRRHWSTFIVHTKAR